MGKPAARLGDMTSHGGTIVAGCPTVLIGGMPAARLSDMHVCPMVNPGPVPHVGGPISLGSTGVFIGGMPAARVGDMAVCTGPPDTIAMGCFTVLIGEVGGGGGIQGATMGGAQRAGAPFTKKNCNLAGMKTQARVGPAPGGASGARAAPPALPALLAPATLRAPSPAAEGLLAKLSGGLAAAWRCLTSVFQPKPEPPPLVTTGLGEKTDKLISKSPLFVQKTRDLQAKGWKLEYGVADGGSWCDTSRKVIVVDGSEKGRPKEAAGTLAHEFGHAGYKTQTIPFKTGMTKKDYVDGNLRAALASEGEATLTEIELRQDLLDHGGADIGMGDANSKKYRETYQKYLGPEALGGKNASEDEMARQAAVNRPKAREEIGWMYADGEQVSSPPYDTYRNTYGKKIEDHYDLVNPPGGK